MVQPSWKTVWLFLKIKCTLTIWPDNPTPRWVNSNFAMTLVGKNICLCCVTYSYIQLWPSARGRFHSSPGITLPPACCRSKPWLELTFICSALDTTAFISTFLKLSLPFMTLYSSSFYQFSLSSSFGPHVSSSVVFLQLLGTHQHTDSKDAFLTATAFPALTLHSELTPTFSVACRTIPFA